jgi:AraC-like DNA-binding protein
MAQGSARRSVPPIDPLRFAPGASRPVRVKARALLADTVVEPHAHPWAQVVFSATGVTRVTSGNSTYIVPPSRAVWIPPGAEHAVGVIEDAQLRTLYVHQPAGQCGPMVDAAEAERWRCCRVLEVSSLLRELVEALALAPEQLDASPDSMAADREQCLARLVLDELRGARSLPLGVALPQDKRLRRLCEAVLADPARHTTLAGWARESGASERTVARLFRQELGSSFLPWRQQVLLSRALLLAARGWPMSHIAAELGYASASAFSAMVSRTVGMPPSQFFGAEAQRRPVRGAGKFM